MQALISDIWKSQGHAYNVIECTGSWTRNVLLSWVDSDGTRRRYKGGAVNGRWKQHGVMDKWLQYSKPSVNKVTVTHRFRCCKKGSKGSAVKVWQLIAGTAVDGDFGNNTQECNFSIPAEGTDLNPVMVSLAVIHGRPDLILYNKPT